MTIPAGVRLDHEFAVGTFSLDGDTFDVENNVWLLGNDVECVVIDAPHSAETILDAVGTRTLLAILCTHAHDDHVRVAPEVRQRTGAPIWLHPEDAPVWELTHPGTRWDQDLSDGQIFAVAGTTLEVLHTPGHSPGAVCFYARDLDCVFSGDTLFEGGPGATGRSFSDRDLIEHSIRTRLFSLPGHTIVRTGHGTDTTIATEQQRMDHVDAGGTRASGTRASGTDAGGEA